MDKTRTATLRRFTAGCRCPCRVDSARRSRASRRACGAAKPVYAGGWRGRPDAIQRRLRVPDVAVVPPGASVSIAAGTCMEANTLSTAAVVCGHDALPWLRDLNVAARLVAPYGAVVTSGAWPA